MGAVVGTLGGAAVGGVMGNAIGEEIAVRAQTLALTPQTDEGAWRRATLKEHAKPLGILSGVVIGGSVGLVTTPKCTWW